FDARPRLGQGRLRVAQPVVDLDDVGAIVGREHLGTDEVALDEATRDRVAIRRASPGRIDVGLDREPLPRAEAIAQTLAHRDDRNRRLVADPGRLAPEIASVQLRMVPAEADELDVREAQADGVDANEELVRRRRSDSDPLRSPVAADLVDALPVDVPGEDLRGPRAGRAAVPVVGGRGRSDAHFLRGRSAALRTLPVVSMMPTFVPIVRGFAANRSPALI